ncbi:MAG: M50 family metallopeptidase [Nitriliruptoraceae bacterium]
MSGTLAITAFVVALLLAILIHELGHLLTAKAVGMKADRYFVGFGPTLWSTRRGETEYGVKAFPLGGFVSIRGMSPEDQRDPPVLDVVLAPHHLRADAERDGTVVATLTDGSPPVTEGTFRRLDEELTRRGTPAATREHILRRGRETISDLEGLEAVHLALHEVLATEVGPSRRLGDLAWRLERGDEGRFYHDRPAWERALAIVSGPLTHLVIAFLLLFGMYLLLALPTGEVTTEVAAVLEDSPAAEAGLEVGDRVLAVEGVTSDRFEVLREEIRARPEEPTTLTLARDGAERTVVLTPRADTDPETGETVGLAGFVPASVEARLGPLPAARRALLGDELDPFGGLVPLLGASVEGLVAVFSPSGIADLLSSSVGLTERDPEGVVSVVGIASIAGQTAQADSAGVYTFLFLLAYLNVFLFIFNMVPLPPFDGGHLAVIGVERTGNLVRRLRGRTPDFTVDPRVVTAVALPVIGLLLLVAVTAIWLDVTAPIQL